MTRRCNHAEGPFCVACIARLSVFMLGLLNLFVACLNLSVWQWKQAAMCIAAGALCCWVGLDTSDAQ